MTIPALDSLQTETLFGSETLDAPSFEDGKEPVALQVTAQHIDWWAAPGKVGQIIGLACLEHRCRQQRDGGQHKPGSGASAGTGRRRQRGR